MGARVSADNVAGRCRARNWHDGSMTAEQVLDRAEDEYQSSASAARLRLVVGRLQRRFKIEGIELCLPPPLQLSVLFTIAVHEPIRVLDLARREGVGSSTMSRVVRALGEAGLVARTVVVDDGRGVLLTVTPRGHGRIGQITRHWTALIAGRVGRLDTAQRDLLRTALPALEMLADDDE